MTDDEYAHLLTLRLQDLTSGLPGIDDPHVCYNPGTGMHDLSWRNRDAAFRITIYDSFATRAEIARAIARAHAEAFPTLRPVVQDFATAMEAQMATHDDRGPDGGWRSDPIDGLLAHLDEEVAELKEAIAKGNRHAIGREAADVGNMAALIADQQRAYRDRP